jgi:hypothetical protein
MRKLMLLLVVLFVSITSAFAQTVEERIVSQRFEQGEMIYRQATGDIYVLSSRTGQWWRYSSTQYGRLATNTQTAPTNRYSPTNGFGRVWNAYRAIRDEIGWAVLPEIGFDTQIDFVGSDIYLHRLDGRIYRLQANGLWNFVETVPPPPEGVSIDSFVVSPLRTSPSATLNIQWEITGAEYALLEVYNTSTNVNIEFLGFLPTSGSIAWGIPESVQGNLTVRLFAANIHHNDRIVPYFWERLLSQDRTVTVVRETFTVTTAAAYQRFANGFMIWREDTGDVRIFLNGGEWQILSEAHYGSLPTNDLTQLATCDVYPVNAFAIIWGTIGNYYQQLGCAPADETGYELTIESSGQTFTYSLPDGRHITLTGNRWSS